MKFLSFLFCFLFPVYVCLSGKDDLELIQEQLTVLQSELQDIENIELGSQRYKEVKALLDDFEDTAIRLQKNVRTLPYMDDIRCADCAKNIRSTAQSAIGMHKKILETDQEGKSILSARRLDPVQALDIIQKDIEAMNEVKFSPNGMKIGVNKGYLCWYQFVRCYTFCKNERKNMKKNIKNIVWKDIFIERTIIMQNLAENMTGVLLQRYGKKIKNIHLDTAVKKFRSDLLRTASEDDIAVLDKHSRKTLKEFIHSETKSKLRKKDADPVAQIDLVIRVVRKDLADKEKQKEKAEKEKKKAEAAEQKEREKQEKQAERLRREEEKKKTKEQGNQGQSVREHQKSQADRIKKLNRASDEEISDELTQIYTKHFPADDQSSLSEEQKKDCMDRMSDNQKKLFESTRTRLAREGVNKDELDLETLKEIRPLLNSRNYRPDRKTAIELILLEDSEK